MLVYNYFKGNFLAYQIFPTKHGATRQEIKEGSIFYYATYEEAAKKLMEYSVKYYHRGDIKVVSLIGKYNMREAIVRGLRTTELPHGTYLTLELFEKEDIEKKVLDLEKTFKDSIPMKIQEYVEKLKNWKVIKRVNNEGLVTAVPLINNISEPVETQKYCVWGKEEDYQDIVKENRLSRAKQTIFFENEFHEKAVSIFLS